MEEAKNGLAFFGGYGFHVKETVTGPLSFISIPCLRFESYLSTRNQINAFTGFSNERMKNGEWGMENGERNLKIQSEKSNLIGFTEPPVNSKKKISEA